MKFSVFCYQKQKMKIFLKFSEHLTLKRFELHGHIMRKNNNEQFFFKFVGKSESD